MWLKNYLTYLVASSGSETSAMVRDRQVPGLDWRRRSTTTASSVVTVFIPGTRFTDQQQWRVMDRLPSAQSK